MSNLKEVYRVKRIKTKNGVANALLHNTRQLTSVKEYIDEKRMKYNIYCGPKTQEELWKLYEEKMKLITSKRKKQGNASWAVEEVHTFSHEFHQNWERDENDKKIIEKYFKDVIEAIQNYKNRKYVMLSYSIHWDETTPHLHILYIPLVYNNEICKYSSSEFVGKRSDLREIQTYLHENVGKRYGLSRGVIGSRAKNISLKKFREDKEKKDEEINGNNVILENLIKSNKDVNEQLKKDKKEIDKKLKDIEKKELEIIKKDEKINEITNVYNQIEKSVDIEIPRIPTPPFEPIGDKRRTFANTWQEKFVKIINKLVSQLKAVLLKNNELLNENNYIKQKYNNAKKRAQIAEKDLAEKPIKEIIEIRKKIEYENKNKADKQGVVR